MTTIEEFKNAPVGATARRPGCPVAVKITDLPTSKGNWDDGLVKMTVETLVDYDYALDPSPVPATAREALDLAWNLAHPVREGQVIPAGTEIISVRSEIERAYGTTLVDQVADGFDELHTRTLQPLPAPFPDWIKAPAVLAATILEDRSKHRTVFARENKTGTQWLRDTKVYRWDELIDVVPLYPKGQCMSEYTPTTRDVRGKYATHQGARYRGRKYLDLRRAEFDRWLNAIKAEAWHEGYGHGRDDQAEETHTGQMHVTPNPHGLPKAREA